MSAVPGRYGWEGGTGTSWFNHPALGITAILLSQTSDALFNGALTEFGAAALAGDLLAGRSAQAARLLGA